MLRTNARAGLDGFAVDSWVVGIVHLIGRPARLVPVAEAGLAVRPADPAEVLAIGRAVDPVLVLSSVGPRQLAFHAGQRSRRHRGLGDRRARNRWRVGQPCLVPRSGRREWASERRRGRQCARSMSATAPRRLTCRPQYFGLGWPSMVNDTVPASTSQLTLLGPAWAAAACAVG